VNQDNPLSIIADWLAEAARSEPANPGAMALATASADGAPSVRMVLLKGLDEHGVTFYTNLGSRKARELRDNPRAALCLYWKSLDRQVRIEGRVAPVSDAEADEYFATRPRLAQIGAWASRQSTPLESRFALEQEVAKVTARFGLGAIPRPEFWSGFRLVPERIELWRQGAFRLHDRKLYTRRGREWAVETLYP
jgi:pyridoxamine 5'-phosphate oxidase